MTKYMEDLQVGEQFVSAGRTITEADIVAFAGLSGDFNQLHTNEPWVRAHTPFRGRIAHGLLVLSISSGLAVPGLDELELLAYLEESRKMVAPTYPGDTIHVQMIVEALRPSASRPNAGVVTFTVEVVNQDAQTVQQGVDVLLVSRGHNE